MRCGRLASYSASEAIKDRQEQESPQWSQEAPLLVRASLVGASTAMMTPLFPVIGLNYLVFRHVPADVRMVWLGGTSMVSYSIMTLVPNAFYYAPVLLPFALGNGVVAGSLYLAADVLAGGPKALAQHRLFNGLVPLFGPALGATTAMLVPYTYPLCWGFVFPWDDSFQDLTMKTIFNVSTHPFVSSCLSFTGLAAGLVIHKMLEPVILGLPGWSWPSLAGSVLAVSGFGLIALYSASSRTTVPHLEDADLDDPNLKGWIWASKVNCMVSPEELCWVPSLDHRSGDACSIQLEPSDFREEDFTLKRKGKPVKGLEEYRKSCRLRERAKKDTARCFLSHFEAFWDGLYKKSLQASDLQRLEQALRVPRVMEDALVFCLQDLDPRGLIKPLEELQSLFSKDLPKKSAAELVQDLGSLRAAQFRELQRIARGQTGPFRADEIQMSLEKAKIKPDRVLQSLKDLDWKFKDSAVRRRNDWLLLQMWKDEQEAAVLVKRLTYSVGAIGLVLLGGYAVMLSQK